MAITSQRVLTVNFTGDVSLQVSYSSASNAASAATEQIVNLSSGNNTITIPTGAGACTIHKPTGNTVALILKGVNGDTGVTLHLTDPDSISLGASGTFVLNAASSLTGLILVWS